MVSTSDADSAMMPACTKANTTVSVCIQMSLLVSSDSERCVITECCTGYAVL